MNTYKVRIENHYVTSKEVLIKADSPIAAQNKARSIFSFGGSDRSIKVKKGN